MIGDIPLFLSVTSQGGRRRMYPVLDPRSANIPSSNANALQKSYPMAD